MTFTKNGLAANKEIKFTHPVVSILGGTDTLISMQVVLVRDAKSVYFLHLGTGKCLKINDGLPLALPTATHCY